MSLVMHRKTYGLQQPLRAFAILLLKVKEVCNDDVLVYKTFLVFEVRGLNIMPTLI